MAGMLISLDVDEASDSWGFVGLIRVGDFEAYRSLEAFATRAEALAHTQALVAGMLGELLAGQEWRHVRDTTDHRGAPTRRDFRLNSLFGSSQVTAPTSGEDGPSGSRGGPAS